MTEAPRPGWYPDPGGSELFRWWDGESWSDATSESATAAPPAASVLPPAEVRRPRSALRTAVVLTVGFALFLTASAGFGLVLWREPRIPLAASGGGGGAPTGMLEEDTRVATVGGMSITLPDEPFTLESHPRQLPGVLDLYFEAHAVVHRRYDGVHHWSAMVLLGRVDPALVRSSTEDLPRTTLDKLVAALFPGGDARAGAVTRAEHAVDNRAGVMVSTDVHYAVDGLASRYDRITLVLVSLDDGSVVAAGSIVPNDTAPAVARPADNALRSLRVE